MAALNSGADDYLTKPYHPQELRSRLGAGIRLVNLTHQLEEANQKLYEAAHTDFLTQLPNRNAILNTLGDEMGRSQRSGSAFVIALADIDHFKRFNDEYGHQSGDNVLKAVARRLDAAKRSYDSVGRYGGEEFLLVLSDVEKDHMHSIADRFRQTVCDKPIEDDGQLLNVTISLGAVWVSPGINPDVDVLLHQADQLLYRAKAEGRNRTCSAFADDAAEPPKAQNA